MLMIMLFIWLFVYSAEVSPGFHIILSLSLSLWLYCWTAPTKVQGEMLPTPFERLHLLNSLVQIDLDIARN